MGRSRLPGLLRHHSSAAATPAPEASGCSCDGCGQEQRWRSRRGPALVRLCCRRGLQDAGGAVTAPEGARGSWSEAGAAHKQEGCSEGRSRRGAPWQGSSSGGGSWVFTRFRQEGGRQGRQWGRRLPRQVGCRNEGISGGEVGWCQGCRDREAAQVCQEGPEGTADSVSGAGGSSGFGAGGRH